MLPKTLLLIPLALGLSGCVVTTEIGPTRRDAVNIERDSSEFLQVNLKMGAGNLTIDPGAKQFLEGALVYNVDSWKPIVRYSTAAGHCNISVDQPEGRHKLGGPGRYEWNLRMPNDIPTDLTVHFGAGEARLNVGSLFLRSVDVQMGVGRLEMDLRGAPRRDYDVRIRGGVGEATVHLPHDVGVHAKAEGGIGSINAPGLRREGGRLLNDAYDHSKVTIHLDIQGGIGSINLISD